MKTLIAAVTTTVLMAMSGAASADMALAQKNACMSCHGVDKKIVGPALKDIAAKYRDDPAAQARINEQVRQGGSGKWGPTLMPPFPMVADEEIKILGDWILSMK